LFLLFSLLLLCFLELLLSLFCLSFSLFFLLLGLLHFKECLFSLGFCFQSCPCLLSELLSLQLTFFFSLDSSLVLLLFLSSESLECFDCFFFFLLDPFMFGFLLINSDLLLSLLLFSYLLSSLSSSLDQHLSLFFFFLLFPLLFGLLFFVGLDSFFHFKFSLS
jgi:hypothetical protein